MTGSLQLILLVLSCLSLAGLGLSGLWVSRAQTQRQKRDARLAAVVTPHVRTQRLEISAFSRAQKPRDQSILGIAAWLFNFDPTNLDRYPLRWWMVVLIALALSKAIHSLAADLAGSLAILVIPFGVVALSRSFFGWFDRRRREQMLEQFPDALQMIVRSVRVGIPVQEAILTVARESPHPTGPEFARLLDQVSVGVAMDDGLQELARRSGLPEYAFSTALSLQAQTGGALSETLENLADVIRKRGALKGKAHALMSEAKATAGILAALPLLIGLVLWILSPSYISLLFTDPTGNKLIAAACISLGVGLFVIRAIVPQESPNVNQTLILAGGGFFTLLLICSGILLMRQSKQQERIAARVKMIHGQPQAARGSAEPEALRVASMQAIAALGQLILRTGFVSARTRSELENNLATAGLPGANGLAIYVGVKILLVVCLPAVAFLLLSNVQLPGLMSTVLPGGAGLIGLLAPDWVIGKRRKHYQGKLEGGLPDALDMMVICAQAGLALGPTLYRVGVELQNAHWEVAQELAQTVNELQMVSDSRIALINLGTRTGIDGFKRLGTTLVQTMQDGTPLTDALRTLSAEMRQDMLTKFEARAARLPVLLTMPTILFILPCVFMIAGGPAIIQIFRAF